MKGPSGLELNGVANIDMIIQQLETSASYQDSESLVNEVNISIKQIKEQLDTLNRYMTAVSKEIHANHHQGKTYVEVPLWHEVRENKDKYKTNGGK